jgi:hypothetical protein
VFTVHDAEYVKPLAATRPRVTTQNDVYKLGFASKLISWDVGKSQT